MVEMNFMMHTPLQRARLQIKDYIPHLKSNEFSQVSSSKYIEKIAIKQSWVLPQPRHCQPLSLKLFRLVSKGITECDLTIFNIHFI